ncbi:MAG: MBL fold metallo-hydrolase, partial [Anaerolineales bacterium]
TVPHDLAQGEQPAPMGDEISQPNPTAFLPVPPTAAQEPVIQEPTMTPTKREQPLTLTILYDNNPFDSRLRTAWGFSALLEYESSILLFDTGGDAGTLLFNMDVLGKDPSRIESVVLSHIHDDHTGGVDGLLSQGLGATVYVPPSFGTAFKNRIAARVPVVEVTAGLPLAKNVFSTGEMGTSIHEQALVVKTARGLVVITGCAHPGVVSIVARARELFDQPVYLVLGGFHLGNARQAELEEILSSFREMGVQKVAPCHCTGERAIAAFREAYGEDFIPAGVGFSIVIE